MTTVIGADGETYTWEANYGNELHEHGGEDLSIPIILERTLDEDEKFWNAKTLERQSRKSLCGVMVISVARISLRTIYGLTTESPS